MIFRASIKILSIRLSTFGNEFFIINVTEGTTEDLIKHFTTALVEKTAMINNRTPQWSSKKTNPIGWNGQCVKKH